MRIDSLDELLVHELRDLWSAEHQILVSLPGVIGAVRDEELKKVYQDHTETTENHVQRLREIFEGLGIEPGGQTCKGMQGLLREVDEVLGGGVSRDVVDAAIIGATQRVEHYEMAGYGVARAFAEMLGRTETADLLQRTLDEEGAANLALTRLAERRLNAEALHAPA
jgi:ferritin-like metal-binding protein YciE